MVLFSVPPLAFNAFAFGPTRWRSMLLLSIPPFDVQWFCVRSNRFAVQWTCVCVLSCPLFAFNGLAFGPTLRHDSLRCRAPNRGDPGKTFMHDSGVSAYVDDTTLLYVPSGYVVYLYSHEEITPKGTPGLFAAMHLPLGGALNSAISANVRDAFTEHSKFVFAAKIGHMWTARSEYFHSQLNP